MTTENKSILEPAGSTTELPNSATESSPSEREFADSLVPSGVFVPLRTGVPSLDEMLRRHHVPRRGLVHLDCATDLPVDYLVTSLISNALGQGEKVVFITVTPQEEEGEAHEESDEEEEREESDANAALRGYDVSTLAHLNALLVSLVRQSRRPDRIVVEGIERLFHPDALSLAESPFPIQGLVDHWYREVLEGQGREGCPRAANSETTTTANAGKNVSESELRARLARVYLCQWLGGQGMVLRSTTTSLWLVPSPGTPSPANSLLTPSSAPSAKVKTQDEAKPQAQAQGEGGANDTANDPSSDESLAPFYIGMRQVLDMYCDYSVRWGAPTLRLDPEGGRVLSVFPLALLNFGLPLDEAPLTHSTDIDFPDTSARAQGEETGEEEEETPAWTPPAGQSFRA